LSNSSHLTASEPDDELGNEPDDDIA
jgi:hypothetical protein